MEWRSNSNRDIISYQWIFSLILIQLFELKFLFIHQWKNSTIGSISYLYYTYILCQYTINYDVYAETVISCFLI